MRFGSKFFSALLVCVAVAGALFAIDVDEIPVHSLNSSEQRALEKNELVMRELDSHEQARIDRQATGAPEVLDKFESLDPNFLAEAVFVLPVKTGREQEILAEVEEFLQQVNRYENIPYYSEHNGTWNPLFEDIRVQELPVLPDGTEQIVTRQKMRPFKHYTAVYSFSSSKNHLVYSSWNRTALDYKWMQAVKPEQMYTALLVEARPGQLFFYGLGGARAFNFFGLFGNRLDVAFTGRIESFFNWFHKEFVQPRLETGLTATE